MKTNTRFLLSASVSLALALTFSCSSDGGGGDGGTSSSSAKVKSSSSKGVDNSSSSISSASMCTDASYGADLPIIYKGQTYETVKIGCQIWMAENLNNDVNGSRCYGDADSNCVKFGRLYNWATAMILPVDCNGITCSGQVQPKHTGVCPEGWHIPSADDWDILMNYVQTDNGSTYTSGTIASIAGKYLKASIGWNGEDKYGFAALPGGICGPSNSSCYATSTDGHWWSTSDGGNGAYIRSMKSSEDRVRYDGSEKGYYRSVRCIKD